jgi:mono/diheme cytochrome c family protein
MTQVHDDNHTRVSRLGRGAAILGAFGVWFLAFVWMNAVVAPSLAAQGSRTVRDGVFTEEQSKRGQDAYQMNCASCHGADLGGQESAPALKGQEFQASWEGLSVGDLFERVRISMPQDAPGRMSRKEYADTLAFIFKSAGMAAGQEELPTELEPLKQIKIEWAPAK